MKKRLNLPRYLIYLTVTITQLFISCSKEWFDIKSDKSLTVPSTVEDFAQLLDNFDAMSYSTPGLGEIASDDYFTTESTLQLLEAINTPERNAEINAYTWSNDLIYEKVKDWDLSFRRIFNCNVVLDGLSKLEGTEGNSTEFMKVKGNAIFHRAKNIYDLSQLYSEPYNPENDSEFGLQLVNSSDVTKITQRSTVHETYDFMISELKVAAELLPLKAEIATQASKLSCWALIARILLIMGKYDECKTYCDSAITHSIGLMNFEEIQNSGQPIQFLNKEVLFQTSMHEYLLTFLPSGCLIDSVLFNSYDEMDVRKHVYFKKTDSGIEFNGSYNNSYLPLLFTGLAIDETILIRAECNAKLNRLENAAIDIEMLLKQRYYKKEDGTSYYTKPSFSNQTEAYNLIYSERKKELLKRGLRWMDMRRLTQDIEFKKPVTRFKGGKTFNLEINSYKYTFPIPMDEITFSNIKQNPGW